MRIGVLITISALIAGCATPVATGPHDTGGGAISVHEGHSTLTEGRATGTGSSAASRGQGPVQGSGAPGEPNNAQSASESNGGNPSR